MSERMVDLAHRQPGFLGLESARQELGITVSYWDSLEAIQAWKQQGEHREAQESGRRHWYQDYSVRISKVEREYGTS